MDRTPGTRTFAAALVAGAALLAFLPGIAHPLLLDDLAMAAGDPRITGAWDTKRILFSPLWEHQSPPMQPLWRPGFHASLWLNHALFGAAPAAFRFVNFLLHAGCSLAVFGLAQRLGAGRIAALAAALFFALHPVHAEAVVGIVGRAELLSSLGVLLAVLAGDAFLRAPGIPRWLLAIAAGAIAISGKEQGLIIAPILLCWTLARPAPAPPRAAGSPAPASPHRDCLMPAALLVAGAAALTIVSISVRARLFGAPLSFPPGSVDPIDNPLLLAASPLERIATALRLSGIAATRLFAPWPRSFSADYSAPGISVGVEPILLTATALCALLAIVIAALALLVGILRGRCTGPAARLGFFGIALTLGAWIPASNLLTPGGAIFAERWLYLPSAGVAIVLAALLERGSATAVAAKLNERPTRLLAAALGVLLLALCWGAATPWRSESALWQQAVRAVPRSAKAHYALGRIAREEGRTHDARRHLSTAIGLWPDYPQALHELALLTLDEAGPPAESERLLRRALALRPTGAPSWNTLGNLAAQSNRLPLAVFCFEQSLRHGAPDPAALRRKIDYTRSLIRKP